MSIQDMTRIEYLISEYSATCRHNPNQVVKIRSDQVGFGEKLTILNPVLDFAEDGRLVPTLPLRHVFSVDFYTTMPFPIGLSSGCLIGVSQYIEKDYCKSGMNLELDVVDYIRPFLESKTKRPGGVRIRLHPNRIKRESHAMRVGDSVFYALPRYGKSRSDTGRILASDMPWEDRIKLYRLIMLPHLLLHVAAVEADSWDRNQLRDSISQYAGKRPTRDVYETIDAKYGVTLLDTMHYKGFWQYAVQPVVGEFMDSGFLPRLLAREIPILQAIVRRGLNAPLRDTDIEFLTYMHWGLSALFLEHPNAVTKFAAALFLPYCEELVTSGVLSRCDFCYGFFRYRKGKKRCSLVSEGRNCGKKASNKRDYHKHREKRLKYYRGEMRKTRAMLKKFNAFTARGINDSQ